MNAATINLKAMRRARADAEELLDSAVEIICEDADESRPLDAPQFSQAAAQTYVSLVRAAVERFEEAANGG